MENIGASVSAVLTPEKKEEVEEVVEEEYHQMENEMIFCLEEAPEYQISAVAEWGENSRGDMVVGVSTFFRHVLTGQRCESVPFFFGKLVIYLITETCIYALT